VLDDIHIVALPQFSFKCLLRLCARLWSSGFSTYVRSQTGKKQNTMED